ncbi:MAG TPA: hypothetical protein VIJ52_00755 [Pseudolabrys sp.]
MHHPDFWKLSYKIKEAGPALSIRSYHIRLAIRRGELVPRQIPGTQVSVLPADELLSWIKSQPPTPPREPRNFKRKETTS